MSEHLYRLVEVVGTSKTGTDDAVRNAIAKADKSLGAMRWFQVVETRGQIDEGRIAYWQVTLKIGFSVKDS
ncbi:dodecin domain-containing protein [bacterium]|nr:dodecin domain-containing protein [bacterium]